MVTTEGELRWSFPCLVMFVSPSSRRCFDTVCRLSDWSWHSHYNQIQTRDVFCQSKKYISRDWTFHFEEDLSCEGNKESICFVTFPCPYWTSAPIKAKLNLIKLVLADLLRSTRLEIVVRGSLNLFWHNFIFKKSSK